MNSFRASKIVLKNCFAEGQKKMHTAKCLFAECQNKGTRQNTSLPSARKKALGKDAFCRVPKNGTRQRCILPSAEKNTRQSHLCRVPKKTLGKSVFAECPIKYTRQSFRHSAKCLLPIVYLTKITFDF